MAMPGSTRDNRAGIPRDALITGILLLVAVAGASLWGSYLKGKYDGLAEWRRITPPLTVTPVASNEQGVQTEETWPSSARKQPRKSVLVAEQGVQADTQSPERSEKVPSGPEQPEQRRDGSGSEPSTPRPPERPSDEKRSAATDKAAHSQDGSGGGASTPPKFGGTPLHQWPPAKPEEVGGFSSAHEGDVDSDKSSQESETGNPPDSNDPKNRYRRRGNGAEMPKPHNPPYVHWAQGAPEEVADARRPGAVGEK